MQEAPLPFLGSTVYFYFVAVYNLISTGISNNEAYYRAKRLWPQMFTASPAVLTLPSSAAQLDLCPVSNNLRGELETQGPTRVTLAKTSSNGRTGLKQPSL